MSVLSIFTLLGGLAFFLYGMTVMSSGLEKMAGGKLEQMLLKTTSNRFLALILGAGITIAIQSSSALTVMLVGLVNSGIMRFGQTIGVLMGSNIGTTLTAWILSLAGIESDNLLINLLKPANFSAIFAIIGIVLMTVGKSEKKQSTGSIFLGFAILMCGMTLMGDAMEPLSESPKFISILTAFKNPFLAVLVGAVFTGIIQSSAASVGILQTLSLTGGITYGMAIPIIMGQNIGTCVTAVLSSIGVNKNAKKVAVVHLAFNCIGTVILLVPYLIVDAFFTIPFNDKPISPFMIAIIHSIFNVVTTFILLPFTKQLERLANRIIPCEEVTFTYPKLDERLITVPSVAIGSAFDYTVEMANLSFDALLTSLPLLDKFDEQKAEDVKLLEDRIDKYEDKLGTFMVRLAKEELSDADSLQVTKMLHTINDFERIGDHACNIVKVAREMTDKNLRFSKEAWSEIKVLTEALCEIVNLTRTAFAENDLAVATKIEPLEQVIDKLIYEIKARHVNRLQGGACTIELGFVLHDLITNYERVSDHCSNVAVAIIETGHGSFKTHEYLRTVKKTDEEFKQEYEEYLSRFSF